MNSNKQKKPSYLHNIAEIIKFLRKIKIRPSYIVLGLMLSFLLAFLEGLSASLLIPLVRGAVQMDFGFLKTTPISKHIFKLLPPLVTSSALATFIFFMVVLFLITMIKNVIKYGYTLINASQGLRLSHNMRVEIFDRYLNCGKLFFDRSHISNLQNILFVHSGRLISIITSFESFIEKFITLTIYFIIMCKISWSISVSMLFIFPVTYYLMQGLIKKIGETSLALIKKSNEIHRKAYNLLTCIPLIKAYNSENMERRKFNYLSETMSKMDFSIDKKNGLIGPIQECISFAAMMLMALYMFFLVTQGKSNIINFMIYFYLLKKVMSYSGIFNEFKMSIVRVTGSLYEVQEILNDKDKFFITSGDKEFTGLKEGIEVKNLFFSYTPDTSVLKGISLYIKKGEVTAIVGPSGCGKTTLISLLLRFYDCPPSSIFVDGTDIRDLSFKSLKKHIAIVSQDTLLFHDTLKSNLIYGLHEDVSKERMDDVVKRARLYDYIKKLPNGFETQIGERGVKLSGGEKQRLSIARALLKDSEILILDEATSSLDSITEGLVHEAIEEAIKNRTAIIVAHRLSTIKNADKIIVIEDGKIVEDGTLSELLAKKGNFYSYWHAQRFD